MPGPASSALSVVTTKKDKSLARLRAAARQLFVARGYHETRPQDIAKTAGVANGTFYLHFSDKQQAFLDFAEQAQNELMAYMAGRLDGVEDSRERWAEICATVVEFGEANPGLLSAAFLDPVFIAPNDDNAWRMYDRLGELVAKVAVHPQDDLNLNLISHGLCGMLRHAMIYAGRSDMDREELVTNLSRFIDRGLNNTEEDR